MRGAAVILASAATWIIVAGHVPMWKPVLRLHPFAVATGVAVGAASAVVSYGFLGSFVPALAIGTLVAPVPASVAAAKDRRRLQGRLDLWPDALAFMRANVSAGLTLPDAAIDAFNRVGGDLGSFEDEIRRQIMFGAGFRFALAAMRSTLDDPVTDRVVATLVVAERSGGHRVGDVLRSLQISVADDLRLRRAHEAALTEQRWTASVALVAPWALLVLSIATNPTASAAYDTPEGAAVIGIGLFATALGWFLARRTARLSEPPRLFR